MTEPFRLAIAGAGMISRNSHLPAAISTPGVHVQALIDPVAERAQQLARDYGIDPRIEHDVRALRNDVDAIIIATPNHTHRDIAIACLDAGIPVLIEKPLATSVRDSEAILDAAQRNDLIVAVGYVTRFWRNVTLLHTLLKDSYFGKVTRFAHQYGTAGGWAPVSGYILDKATAGGGVLTVTGSHFIDRMLAVWGYPTDMLYRDDSLGGPEANCHATLTFDQLGWTIRGYLRYSKSVSLPKGLVIETERGLVTLLDDPTAEIELTPYDAPNLRLAVRGSGHSTDAPDPFALQLDDFVAACRNKSAPLVDGAQGLNSVRLLSEMYERREPLKTNWYDVVCG